MIGQIARSLLALLGKDLAANLASNRAKAIGLCVLLLLVAASTNGLTNFIVGGFVTCVVLYVFSDTIRPFREKIDDLFQ